jgi:glucose-6-phosphate isomerase
MQSKKITKLLESKNKENETLALTILETNITDSNKLFWSIYLNLKSKSITLTNTVEKQLLSKYDYLDYFKKNLKQIDQDSKTEYINSIIKNVEQTLYAQTTNPEHIVEFYKIVNELSIKNL